MTNTLSLGDQLLEFLLKYGATKEEIFELIQKDRHSSAAEIVQHIKTINIGDLKLSIRARKALNKLDTFYSRDVRRICNLRSWKELSDLKNCGLKSRRQIRDALKVYGLTLQGCPPKG